MTDLETTLARCLENCSSGYSGGEPIVSEEKGFMMLPLTEETFELPVFALNDFCHMNHSRVKEFDYLAVKLNYIGRRTVFKSLDARMRDTLNNSYRVHRLMKLDTIDNKNYYASFGSIFDNDFKPIMTFTWQLKKVYNKESRMQNDYKLDYVRPILRVTPEVFAGKNNAVEKYIVNKIMPKALSLRYITRPNVYINDLFLRGYSEKYYKLKIEIDAMPFTIKQTDTPSISTTNRELFDIVLNHMDEVAG